MAKNKALNDAFNAGKTAAAANQWDAAIDGFTKAGELDANQHVVWGNLADSYVSRSKATPANQRRRPGQSRRGLSESHRHQGRRLGLSQQLRAGAGAAEEVRRSPGGADQGRADRPAQRRQVLFQPGRRVREHRQLDPAAAAFKKAIDLDPNYAEAYYQYGLSLMGKATIENGKTVAPAGHGGSLPEVSGSGADRSQRGNRQSDDGQHGCDGADQFLARRLRRSRRKSSKFGVDVPSLSVSDRIPARNERDPVCTRNHHQSF